LGLINYHTMKTNGIVEVQLHNLALDGGEWSTSHNRPLYPQEQGARFPFDTGWYAPRASLDAAQKRTISCLCREQNPTCLAHSISLYWLSSLAAFHVTESENKLFYY
jgi:hypothetical protein